MVVGILGIGFPIQPDFGALAAATHSRLLSTFAFSHARVRT